MALDRHQTTLGRLRIAFLALALSLSFAAEGAESPMQKGAGLLLQDLDGNSVPLASLHDEQPLFVATLAHADDIEPAFRWITLVHSLAGSEQRFRSAMLYLEEPNRSAGRTVKLALLNHVVRSGFLRQQAYFGTHATDWPHGNSLSFYLLDREGAVRWSCSGYPSDEQWQKAVASLSQLP